MATKALTTYRLGAIAVALLLILLLTALHFMSNAIQNSEQLSHWFVPLLIFIVSGLVTMVALIGWNLVRLLREYRRDAAGSRLMARMIILFVLIALPPVGIVYFYSLQFLVKGIDSWFDVQVDEAMQDALDLNRASLAMNKRILLRVTENFLSRLEDSSQAGLALTIGELRGSSGATEMTLMDRNGGYIASSNVQIDVLVPSKVDVGILQQVVAGEPYAGITPFGEDGALHIRCVVADERGLVLRAMYPTSEVVSDLSDKVQIAYVNYRERAYLRDSIKFSFTLTLSLVLLLAIFAAAWAAFITARRMVSPIADIVEGTKAIAEGDYDRQLTVPKSQGELNFLVASFNTMTRKISQARDLAQRSQDQLASQHTYLETVLGHLSTGVMALDGEHHIRNANTAAGKILRIDVDEIMELGISRLVEVQASLQPFVESVTRGLEQQRPERRDEIQIHRRDGKQVLLCYLTKMVSDDSKEMGWLIVFDDVTALVQAQRDAAWGEVARRLAHEIKNPLTPIQLSAERLRRKYLGKIKLEDRDLLDSATTMIVNQVEAMKSMVNAFSDYAKPSRMERELIRIDSFIADVLGLYGPKVGFSPGARDVVVEADAVRLRQVIHNLIKNSIEATSALEEKSIDVETLLIVDNDRQMVELSVRDNGPGIPEDALDRVFEPYVTTKEKGTGLGLAIVKKIIEEHGGSIYAENGISGGTYIIITLPVKD